MYPEMFAVLDKENKHTNGAVENYIYRLYGERQGVVTSLLNAIENAQPKTFQLSELFDLFTTQRGLRRSIDKVYEIVAHSLFETVVAALEANVRVSIPQKNKNLLREFADLSRVLLGIDENSLSWEQSAHIYRVGVTNAADRGLDMWANFGPAVQVKHLTLNERLAQNIIDQVESDYIVIVCRDADANVIQVILNQIGWGRRVRGLVKESELIAWYEKCLRGKFKDRVAMPLLERLREGFKAEFPQTAALADFLKERGYSNMTPPKRWRTDLSLPSGY
jgi:type II restriction enzyme